jgi:glycerophosphoryl diester phosphodiesterase
MLRHAEALRPCLVEADLHLRRGRVEVRHLKALGPLPLLWDRWRLAPGWRPRLQLGALLAAAGPGTELMLDLKGRDARLARRVADALTGGARPLRITVCARNWALLRPLEGLDGVRLVYSVGSRRQLRALRRRFAGRRLAGISIHRDLLDAGTVADLRTRADVVMTWPVASVEEARALAGWGVDGVITERFDALAAALA